MIMEEICTSPWLFGIIMFIGGAGCGNTIPNDSEGMVANGEIYDSVKYPYVMHVIARGQLGAHTCTGSLINPVFVLTAAHCTDNMSPSNMEVVRGHYYKSWQDNTLRKQVKTIYQHEKYINGTNDVPDISLLEIESEYEGFTEFVEIAGTPEEFENDKTLPCVVIGFGRMETQKSPDKDGYQANVLAGYGKTACHHFMNDDEWKFYVCARPNKKMVCQGDSGGPLICNGKQYGSVKDGFNFVTGNFTVCGDPDVQTRHLFLYMFKEWIFNIIKPDDDEYEYDYEYNPAVSLKSSSSDPHRLLRKYINDFNIIRQQKNGWDIDMMYGYRFDEETCRLLYKMTIKNPVDINDEQKASKVVLSIKGLISRTIEGKILPELDKINHPFTYSSKNSVKAVLKNMYGIDLEKEIVANSVEKHINLLNLFYGLTVQDGYYNLGFDKVIVGKTKE
ncbi:chymotrypsin-like protease CTRL-1 [Daktulosphaira vitifoliae]|uniref:chymotrypsin-like protease CTRL-1 n=1 Tax=Daktulosphaira vitifoliae TaxID=58002 RepID=UPI0021A9D5D2|nr:chymotrypsin-like protease CTRL-1 [Daktulosphaira vitifoliae]